MGFGDWLKGITDAGQDFADWGNELLLGEKGANAYKESRANSFLPGTVKKAGNHFESIMAGMDWLYSNGVSQPLSTTLLQTQRADQGDFFSASEWARSWRAAEHISVGQSYQIAMQPWRSADITEESINSDLVYAAPASSALPPDWDDMGEGEQQDWLRSKGMPAIGNRRIEEYRRDSQFFKFASGAADLTARWYLDPIVLSGKGIGAARRNLAVKPRPEGGWSEADIATHLESSSMRTAQKFLWENKDNSALINNLSMFRKSALGPRAGGIVSRLNSENEVNLFLRVSMGDVRARAALEDANAVVANRLRKDTARLPELDLALSRVADHGNPAAEAMIKSRMDEVNAAINADTGLVQRYQGMLDHYGELDALNLTRGSFARAERRTRAQRDYRAGPALKATGHGPMGVVKLNSDFFGTPLTVVRSFKEAHPNGLIKVDDIHKESVDELRGHLSRIPAIGPDIRQDVLNRYLGTTTEGERITILDEVGRLGAKKIAERHGLTADEGLAIYNESRKRLAIETDNLRRYSAATHPGESVHVDEFMDAGGKLVVHPNLVTRLANDHVMMDLAALDLTLTRHSSALKALRTKSAGNTDWMVGAADYFNHLWKFTSLFRLGYIPRVLADDLTGQVARLGAASMAMRAGYGVKNLATNLAQWKRPSALQAQEASLREGLKYADEELALLRPQADTLRSQIDLRRQVAVSDRIRANDRLRRARNKLAAMDPATATPTHLTAMQRLVTKHEGEVRTAVQGVEKASAGTSRHARLAELDDQLSTLALTREEALAGAEGAKQAAQRGFRRDTRLLHQPNVEGVVLPAALGGERGEYYQKLIGSDDSLRNLFATNKQMIHGNLQRAYSNSGKSVSFPQDPELFLRSWDKAVNHQIMQDALAVQAVKGASIDEMAKWLSSTPAGRAHRKRLGLKYNSNERIAASVFHEVESYLPTWELRTAALEGRADAAFFKSAADKGHRPFEVHTTELGEGLAGTNHLTRAVDRVIDKWFKVASAIPADRMSRHPLFNQLYEGHAKTLVSQEMKQGAKVSQADADRIAETARRLALRDTRGLVFDIAHRSDVGHALRFISPFFSATTESWQRWARIIADKPQVVGYAGQFFNAPASMGWMQDSDGNRVFSDGTVIDPVTGEKKLVSKKDRYIMARVPSFIADGPVGKAFGIDSSKRWQVSQDSMNLITQGDPWFNPGTGPIVSIPVNEWVRDKPKQAELARHLGILPFGPETSTLFGDGPVGRAAALSMPAAVKNFLTAFDTSDERYQRIKLQIMQRAAYEHANLGKPMPTAKEIAAQTRNYWLTSAAWSFSSPAATQRPDKYEFYRQQYRNLTRKNAMTADQEFIERYGESFFTFAASTSDTSIPPTMKAVKLYKENEALIAKHPELASLIIGPKGDGPFSPEAWAYGLNHPLVPGDAEMMTRKLTAEEAMSENERRKGWAKYTQLANAITAELHSAGFDSFSDEGAEEFQDMRSAIGRLLGDPMGADGEENPYYNEEWSKDFYTMDPRKYDRLIPHMTAIANSPLADNPNRSDLRMLRTYLLGRQALTGLLVERGAAGGARTLKAQANSDLATGWGRFVDGLIERDTRFGDLYHRYLSRDLGVDVEDMDDDTEEVA